MISSPLVVMQIKYTSIRIFSRKYVLFLVMHQWTLRFVIVVYICKRRFSDGFIWLTKLDAIQQCRFSAKSSYEQKWLATFFAGDSGGFWQQALFWSLFCLFLTRMIVTQGKSSWHAIFTFVMSHWAWVPFNSEIVRQAWNARVLVGFSMVWFVCLFVCLFFVTQSA